MDNAMDAASSQSSAELAEDKKGAAPPSLFSRFFATRRKTKMAIILVLVLGIIAIAVAVPVTEHAKSSSHSTASTSVSGMTLLVDNDLQGAVSNRSALIMLGPRTYADAEADCKALGEELWGADNSSTATIDSIKPMLDYLVHLGHASSSTRFFIGAAVDATNSDGSVSPSSWRTVDGDGNIAAFNSTKGLADTVDTTLSAFCTQTAPYSNHSSSNNDPTWEVRVRAASDKPDNGADGVAEYVGRRDHNSFRFLGLRYAPQPTRFEYSTPYWNSTASQTFNSTTFVNTTAIPTISATKAGSACIQSSGGSEDCLYLNIYTPYLPAQQDSSSTAGVFSPRPVMFFIHGGGFTGGTAGDPSYDGGNLASRGDVVVVTINYRLSTLGYLALDSAHGGLNGNYGLSDQIMALNWVRDNIASFGGDSSRITIFGQSAGAGSVRAMMASPKAEGKFAAAIMMSNLGGLNYGKTYSEYYSIEQSTNVSGTTILETTNCTTGGDNSTTASSTAEAIVDCLRAVPASKLVALRTVARYIVVDGTFITSDHLDLGPVNTTASSTTTPYALMMGTMRDDGTPFISFPSSDVTVASDNKYLASQGYDNVSTTLFPIPTSSSNTTLDIYNMSSRVSTDALFRCVDEATVYAGVQNGVFSSAYYYEFDRSYQTDWPNSNVCGPDPTTAHPDGDPSLPYFRCHSGELYYVFGNVARQGLPWRDDGDLPFMQYVLDSFTSFARTYSPNPETDYLKARGFTNTLALQKKSDNWAESTDSGGMSVHLLDWPKSTRSTFRDQQQCESLGLGLKYYL